MMQYESSTAPGEAYQLGRRLKAGSTSDVYETVHPHLPGSCAIKILRPHLLQSPEQVHAFRSDLEAVSGLRHPNIAQIIEVGSLPEAKAFVVMELLEGRLLAERLAGHRTLPIGEVVELVKAIAAALQAAHSRGVIHGEIGPTNVFLARAEGYEQGLVKLIGFGIHRLRPVDAAASLSFEMIRYLSPEQATGRPDEVDGRADQFALALLIHRMVSGIEVFRGLSAIDVLDQVLHEEPKIERPPEITDEVESVLRRALAKDKRHRFETVVGFARAFESSVTGEESSVVKRTPAPRGRPVRIEPPPPEPERPRATIRAVRIEQPHKQGPAATTLLGFAASRGEESREVPRAVITAMGPPRAFNSQPPPAAQPAAPVARPQLASQSELPVLQAGAAHVRPVANRPVLAPSQPPKLTHAPPAQVSRAPAATRAQPQRQPPRAQQPRAAAGRSRPGPVDSLLMEPFFDAFPSGQMRADTMDLGEDALPRRPRNGWRFFFFLVAIALVSVGGAFAVGWRPPLEWRQSDLWRGMGLPGAADPSTNSD
jgi:eukaryotic-like serine/threonine-protein kinase